MRRVLAPPFGSLWPSSLQYLESGNDFRNVTLDDRDPTEQESDASDYRRPKRLRGGEHSPAVKSMIRNRVAGRVAVVTGNSPLNFCA
jgi:hypothetical protein